MKRCIGLAVLASLAVGVGMLQAQDAITIKIKTRAEGDSIVIAKKETTTSKVKIEDGKGNVIADQNEKGVETTEYKETVLKRDGKKPPAKVEREYTKHQHEKGDKVVDSPLQGKTVVIERVGDKHTFAFKDGGQITGPTAAKLSQELDRKGDSSELEKLMLPKTAVKVGESWKLDMAPIIENLFKGGGEFVFDDAKAVGSGKLTKAYKKGEQQFGVLQYQITIPLKTLGKGDGQMKFADGAKMSLEMTMDACIDGTSEAGTIHGKMSIAGNATLGALPGATAVLDIQAVTEGTQSEPRKK